MADSSPGAAIAEGRCITHHGELFQGAVRRDGVVTPCLVSLPRHDRIAVCRLELFEARALEVVPSWKSKALRSARLVLERFGRRDAAGRLTLVSQVEPGLGLGSSTADVVAAARAAAALVGAELSTTEMAAIAVEAELAVDPLMFDLFALLFAQRSGEILEDWGHWYPDFAVVGVNLAAPGIRVDTLALPPLSYSEAELDEFETLVAMLREGFRERDPVTIAQVATRSAELNQAHLPLPGFDTVRHLAEDAGALGVQISHSGVVGGILLDGGDSALDDKLASLRSSLRDLTAGPFDLFRTRPS